VGARAQEGLAWCAYELGDDASCQKLIEQALAHPELKDRGGSLYELLATLHHRAQRWEPAAAAARAGLEKYPNHPRAGELRYALGASLARAGKDAEARPVLEQCVTQGTRRPDRAASGWVTRRRCSARSRRSSS
jgi:uncharacterized protein HemY